MCLPVSAFIAPGGGEMILILLVLILLFGAKDAPRILRNIQNSLNKLQRTAADFRYKLMYGDLHGNNPGPSGLPPAEETSDEGDLDNEAPDDHCDEEERLSDPESGEPADPPPDSKVQP